MKRTRAQQPKPRQPKAGATKKATAAATARMAPTVPDVCGVASGEGEAAGARGGVEDWDLDAGLDAAAWWTWGVDEEKLLGWFPFVEEDFRCAGGRAGDAEIAVMQSQVLFVAPLIVLCASLSPDLLGSASVLPEREYGWYKEAVVVPSASCTSASTPNASSSQYGVRRVRAFGR
ncbi:hypothetical protein BAE44_0018231 [Dichanthelium oligosanthes]|uniref:Uncharacterized protein n=1 Tax=Dichanthelium oligosanthes TaxID=888268 RepID=A0A1E5V6G3_9POAL|nr:hypothetical protein BAE44_0018231 [Dichanthelium oligosanthes]